MGYLRQIAPLANFITVLMLAAFTVVLGYRWVFAGQAPVSVIAGMKAVIFLIVASVITGWASSICDSLSRVLRRPR